MTILFYNVKQFILQQSLNWYLIKKTKHFKIVNERLLLVQCSRILSINQKASTFERLMFTGFELQSAELQHLP